MPRQDGTEGHPKDSAAEQAKKTIPPTTKVSSVVCSMTLRTTAEDE